MNTRIAALLTLLCVPALQASAQTAVPRLVTRGETVQLHADGRPFLLLAGELGNSTASDPATLAPIWPRLRAAGLNTVLAPVYWELVEPVEAAFDFSTVDTLLAGARRHDLRLVLLWFGSWKNSMSTYAPSWVKRDPARFPRARTSDGSPLDILTPFAPENVEADARAFAALMRHLASVDAERHTVLMVQVENEVGMIPEARDRSPAAESAWWSPVPHALLDRLSAPGPPLHPALATAWAAMGNRTHGTWPEVFGTDERAEELFMAWHFAGYVERVAAAGKERLPLPMFVNAALVRPGRKPGEYPSAGPLPHLVDLWKTAAPSIDFLAPDIYFPNFVEWARAYDLPRQPFFVPEAGYAGSSTAVADALFAFGALDAIGFSPFSIEDLPSDALLAAAYEALASIEGLVTERQGTGPRIAGFRPPVAYDESFDESPQEVVLGDYLFRVSFVDPWTPREAQAPETHGGLALALSDDTFLVVGSGVTITFEPLDAAAGRAFIDRAEEGRYVDGAWVPGRRLNGDQTHQGRHMRLPPGTVAMQLVRLYAVR